MAHRKAAELLLLLLLAAIAGGCSTMGTGIGYTPSGAVQPNLAGRVPISFLEQ